MINSKEQEYLDYVYNIIFLDTMDMDCVYKDYILRAVGTYGFNILYRAGLLEGCGSVNGRELFVLLDKNQGDDTDGE